MSDEIVVVYYEVGHEKITFEDRFWNYHVRNNTNKASKSMF